jgi:hypothetical protein
MKTKLHVLCAVTIIAIFQLMQSCTDRPPNFKRVALKVYFKTYSGKNYICSTPAWNPEKAMLMPSNLPWDYTTQSSRNVDAYQISVQQIKSNGNKVPFSDDSDVLLANGELSIPVPAVDKFEITLNFATPCKTHLKNLGLDDIVMYELWDNHQESNSYFQIGSDIIITMVPSEDDYNSDFKIHL